ncbi:Putative uncharacterized protein FLJ37770 [Eumeta japonica]|uniref:Histone-lysine N-methyltransferase SETMAR n=1 Tax=Eumeta variegata TaxID=151549 RepID=A0A4C1WRZ8_EUMVA|nr:Putative uncharacterized protein FLJ37770 [Eumeta japonica]
MFRSLATVCSWFNKFKRGHTNLTDDLRMRCPSTATTEDNISALRLMKETERKVTYQQIHTSLGIGKSQVDKILHERLAVRKLYTRWIPRNLTEAQKLCRINKCREMMQRLVGGDSNAAYDIVTDGKN